MRRKLLLTIALAVAGTTAVVGSAGGADRLLDVGSDGVDVNIPGGENLPPIGSLPACSNLKDDDGDGATDLADGGCNGPLDSSEAGGTAPAPPSTPTSPTPPTGSDDDGIAGPGGGGGRGSGQAPGGSGGNDNGNGGAHPNDRSDEPTEDPPNRNPDGTPTDTNPTLTVADFGAAPMGVPNFVIDKFTIPPFLLPIYQACGTQYGIPWEVLASINRIETAFGTNLNVSSAGALGWMQFIPSSWEAYGVDANEDGRKDPYNPVDAICAAARYLNAAGGEEDLRTAIFAYNHADWYVDEVLLYANQYGKLPGDLVTSLTGLTEGARFPVAADSRYADDISEREAKERAKPGKGATGNAADLVSSSPTRRGIDIFSKERAPVVAVNDGFIHEVGESKKLGKYIVLEDNYGNQYTYAGLGSISEVYPVPEEKKLTAKDLDLFSSGGGNDDAPNQAASAGRNNGGGDGNGGGDTASSRLTNTEDSVERVFALPERRNNLGRADISGQLDELLADRFPGYENFKNYFGSVLKFDEETMELRSLHEGSKVVAGTVLGRLGPPDEMAPHVNFSIRPAGRGAPKIDPKPILDGWKLLEATAIYRAAGKNPLFGGGGASIGQILLMSKDQLARRVVSNPDIEFPPCDRHYILGGQIERRLLAALEYLTARGFRLTVTSLHCGRETSITSSGNISHHSVGGAADIAAINGQPVLGNQGPGTLSYALVRDLMELQGTMVPTQIISLMDLGGTTFAMGDHADHVHVGYAPEGGPGSSSDQQMVQLLKPDQWERLIGRIAEIDNPDVPTSPSRFSLPAPKNKKGNRASAAHVGE